MNATADPSITTTRMTNFQFIMARYNKNLIIWEVARADRSQDFPFGFAEDMQQYSLPLKVDIPEIEYIPYAEDMARMVCIQVVLQIMLVLQGAAQLDSMFIALVLYMMLGVSVYWLVVKRLITFS
jgi:hypothetical protein